MIAYSATVQSQGTGVDAATITIDGNSGPTDDSNGVAIGKSGEVASIDGNIQIIG